MIYLKLTIKGHADERARTFMMMVASETDQVIIGTEVNKEGESISGPGFDERIHYLMKACILKRTDMKMSNQYGRLEPS